MKSEKKYLLFLRIISVLAFLVSMITLATSSEMKEELKLRHLLNITGLTLGIIFIGMLLMRRHLRDSGIIILFGNLLLVAEVLFNQLPSAELLIISSAMMALTGLGFIVLAKQRKNNP